MDGPRSGEDLLPPKGIPAAFDGATRDEIDPAAEEPREVVLDGDVVEEAPFGAGKKRDEEVDVASGPLFAAGHRTENVEFRDSPATTRLGQPGSIDSRDSPNRDGRDRGGRGVARHALIIRFGGNPLPGSPRYGGHGPKASEPCPRRP